MNLTIPNPFGPVVFVMFGCLLASVVFYLSGWMSGWRRLANLYPCESVSVPFEPRVSLCWLVIRRDDMATEPLQQPFTQTNFSYTFARLTVCDRGLFTTKPAPFNIGHPPVFIPWGDLTLIGRRGRYEYEHNHVIMRVAKQDSICLVISGETADQLLKLGSPFLFDGDGQLVSNRQDSQLQIEGQVDMNDIG